MVKKLHRIRYKKHTVKVLQPPPGYRLLTVGRAVKGDLVPNADAGRWVYATPGFRHDCRLFVVARRNPVNQNEAGEDTSWQDAAQSYSG